MKSINDLFFIGKRLWSGKMSTVISCMIAVFSLFLVELIVFSALIGSFVGWLMDQSFYGGTDQNLLLESFTVRQDEVFTDHLSYLETLPGVRAIGNYRLTPSGVYAPPTEGEEVLRRISEIQAEHGATGQSSGSADLITVSGVMSSVHAFGMFPLKLYDGYEPEHYRDSDYNGLFYLGYGLKEIPVGTEIEYHLEGYDYKYVVAGILEKGSFLFNPELITTAGKEGDEEYQHMLDYDVVDLFSYSEPYQIDISNARFFCSVEKGYKAEEVLDRILLESQKKGIKMTGMVLSERKRGVNNFLATVRDHALTMLMITPLAVAVIFICSQMLGVLNRSREFGVWMASGISKGEIIRILIGENLVKILFSYLIGTGLCFLTGRYLMNAMLCPDLLKENLISYAVPIACIVIVSGAVFALFLVVISSILPVLFFARVQTIRIVKGDFR